MRVDVLGQGTFVVCLSAQEYRGFYHAIESPANQNTGNPYISNLHIMRRAY